MNTIEPTQEQAKGLLKKLPKGQPVIMLNLLKFKERAEPYADGTGADETGETAYMKYARNLEPLLERAGGKLFFAGAARHFLIGDAAKDWDMVIMVEYPDSRAFIKMTASEDYQKIHVDRERGLERTELIVTQNTGGLG